MVKSINAFFVLLSSLTFSKKQDVGLEKELEKLNEMLKKDFDSTVKKSEEEIDKTFMNFKARNEVVSKILSSSPNAYVFQWFLSL